MLPNVINAAMYYAPSAWKVWIDHVIRHEHSLGLSKAALVRHNGLTASATCDFVLGQNDIKKLNTFFSSATKPDRITIKGRTYIVRDSGNTYLVAFNGSKYVIVCRSKTMYLVATCSSRDKCPDATRFLRALNKQLISKNF